MIIIGKSAGSDIRIINEKSFTGEDTAYPKRFASLDEAKNSPEAALIQRQSNSVFFRLIDERSDVI